MHSCIVERFVVQHGVIHLEWFNTLTHTYMYVHTMYILMPDVAGKEQVTSGTFTVMLRDWCTPQIIAEVSSPFKCLCLCAVCVLRIYKTE